MTLATRYAMTLPLVRQSDDNRCVEGNDVHHWEATYNSSRLVP